MNAGNEGIRSKSKGLETEGILGDKGGMMGKVTVAERITRSGEKMGKRREREIQAERERKRGRAGKKCPRFPGHLTGSKNQTELIM